LELKVIIIGEVLCTGEVGRLRWFGYMERMRVDNLVKRCMSMAVEGKPKRTWWEVLHNDFRVKELNM